VRARRGEKYHSSLSWSELIGVRILSASPLTPALEPSVAGVNLVTRAANTDPIARDLMRN
jgi:hypothetical protein